MMTVTTANHVVESTNDDSAAADKNIFSGQQDDIRRGNNDPRHQQPKQNKQPRRDKRDVHGWVILDKPIGMTSTHAVAVVKRLFSAKRAGHAGTLDPLASGLLPIALGEATKTVPFVMDGRKRYRFTVRWGAETDTDDSEGRIVAASDARPTPDAVRAALPRFTGAIEQVPPKFSAIKIDGERAYDLARDGEAVELIARTVEIHQLALTETPDADHAVFEAECGKGTYVRALARDLGRALGSAGHVVALRRTAVGPFSEAEAVGIDALSAYGEAAAAARIPPPAFLLGVETALQALPSLNVSSADAARLARGQAVLLRGRDAPMIEGWIAVSTEGRLIALATAEKGELHPKRIFNLSR
jgi:tRNA pseudouridine55 synthase